MSESLYVASLVFGPQFAVVVLWYVCHVLLEQGR